MLGRDCLSSARHQARPPQGRHKGVPAIFSFSNDFFEEKGYRPNPRSESRAGLGNSDRPRGGNCVPNWPRLSGSVSDCHLTPARQLLRGAPVLAAAPYDWEPEQCSSEAETNSPASRRTNTSRSKVLRVAQTSRENNSVDQYGGYMPAILRPWPAACTECSCSSDASRVRPIETFPGRCRSRQGIRP
jgi:hypothetical protein